MLSLLDLAGQANRIDQDAGRVDLFQCSVLSVPSWQVSAVSVASVMLICVRLGVGHAPLAANFVPAFRYRSINSFVFVFSGVGLYELQLSG